MRTPLTSKEKKNQYLENTGAFGNYGFILACLSFSFAPSHYHLHVKVVNMQGSVDSAGTKPGRRKAAASLRGGSRLAIGWKQQFSCQRTDYLGASES
jgi:hypothetical protein